MYQFMLVPTRFSTTAERALAICKYGPSFSDRCTDTAVFGLWACGHGTRIERNKALERRQLEVPQKAVMAYHHSAACWCAVAGGPATGELPSKATADLQALRQGRLEPETRPAGWLCSRRRLPALKGCACGQTALSMRSAGPRRQSQRRPSRASGENSESTPHPPPPPPLARSTCTAPVRTPSSPHALEVQRKRARRLFRLRRGFSWD